MAIYVTAGPPRALAHLALQNHLYVPDGSLAAQLADAVADDTNVHMAIAQADGRFVGVGIIDSLDMIAVYVIPEYRRRLIGTRLVEIVRAKWGKHNSDLTADYGDSVRISNAFWDQLRVVRIDDVHELSTEQQHAIATNARTIHEVLQENRQHQWQRLTTAIPA